MSVDIKIPNWMDDHFLKTCVRTAKNIPTNIDIRAEIVYLNSAVSKGENYMSVTNRLKVLYNTVIDEPTDSQSEEVSFIVKVLHENDEMAAIVGQNFFEREAKVYRDIVPGLQGIINGTNSKSKMFCKLIHCVGERPKFVILEDLKPEGYIMGDRLKGFDLAHCKRVLQDTAKFHASSMCFFHDQPDSLKLKFSKSIFDISQPPSSGNNGHDNFIVSVEERTSILIDKLKEINLTKYKKVVDYLYKYLDNMPDSMSCLVPYRHDNILNALNHVDFWVNNIMLKYSEDGSIDDVVIIDFQCCQYTTVAYDFNFFFFSSTNMEVRTKYYEKLYHHYYTSLIHSLQEMNYAGKMPTLEDFKKDLKETRIVVFHLLLVMLPLFLMKPESWPSHKDKEEVHVHELLRISEEQGNRLYDDAVLASLDVLLEHGFF